MRLVAFQELWKLQIMQGILSHLVSAKIVEKIILTEYGYKQFLVEINLVFIHR